MNKIRKGDEVIVLAGKDKGKRGRVAWSDGGPKTDPMSCRIVLQGAFGSSWELLK